jgi:hypothetical protein
MTAITEGFQPSNGKMRIGRQPCPGLPASEAELLADLRFTAETLTMTPTPVADPSLTGSEDPDRPLPGPVALAGTITTVARAEELNILFAAAIGHSATPVDLGDGAWEHKLSAAETDLSFPFPLSLEINRDDGAPVLFWDVKIAVAAFNFAAGAPITIVWTVNAGRSSTYDEGRRLAPLDVGTIPGAIRGWPPLSIAGDLDPDWRSVLVEIVSVDPVAGTADVLAKWGKSQPLSGSHLKTIAVQEVAVTGGKCLSEMTRGMLVNMGDEVLTVESVDSNNQWTATTPAAATANIAAPTSAFGATLTTIKTGLDAREAPNWSALIDSRTALSMGRERSGPLTDEKIEDMEVYLDLSELATVDMPLTGASFTLSELAGTLDGTGSAFDTELHVGAFVQVGAASGRVATITSPTTATLEAQVAAGPVDISAAATTRAQFLFDATRPDWLPSFPDVPPFVDFTAAVSLRGLSYDATAATVTHTLPSLTTPVLGSRYPLTTRPGQTSTAATFTHEKRDLKIDAHLRSGGVAVLVIDLKSLKSITPDFDREHGLTIVANLTSNGSTATLAAPASFAETFSGIAGSNPDGAPFTASVTFVLTGAAATL